MLDQGLMYNVEVTTVQLPFLMYSQGVEDWENRLVPFSAGLRWEPMTVAGLGATS